MLIDKQRLAPNLPQDNPELPFLRISPWPSSNPADSSNTLIYDHRIQTSSSFFWGLALNLTLVFFRELHPAFSMPVLHDENFKITCVLRPQTFINLQIIPSNLEAIPIPALLTPIILHCAFSHQCSPTCTCSSRSLQDPQWISGIALNYIHSMFIFYNTYLLK